MSAWFASQLRRLLPPGLVAALVLLAALALRGTGSGSGDDELARAARALARAQSWSLLLLLAPFLAARAAAAARPAAQAAWLAGGAHRARLAAGPVAAALAGAALVAGLVLAIDAALLDGAQPVQRRVARPASPERVLHAEDGALAWSVPRPRGVRTARLTLGLAPASEPSVDLVLGLRDGAGRGELRRTLSESSVLTLELPPEESGTLELTLARAHGSALLVLGAEALELFAPAGTEGRATAVFALHAALALGLLLVLAGLAAQALAAPLAAALACALGLAGAGLGLAPLDGLVEAWNELASGRAPALPSVAGFALTLVLALACVALQARTRRGGAP